FPLAYKSNAINIKKPTICAYSKNFSLGFLPVIISYSKNITCPPSNAGMGSIFIKAKIIDKKAVESQNPCQSQESGKSLAIVPNPPTSVAPFLVKRNFIELA